MSMSYDDVAYDEYMAEIGREEEARRAIRQVSVETVSDYLASFGDALEARIRGLITEATELLDRAHPGPSLVVSFTAIELLLRHFVLKPLVTGAFLSDYWADLLVDRVVSGCSARDRELLPLVAAEWEIDLQRISLSDGSSAWAFLTSEMGIKRNHFVHKGHAVSQEVAVKGIKAAEALFSGLLHPIAKKFELSWPESGAWNSVVKDVGAGRVTKSYPRRDPFE